MRRLLVTSIIAVGGCSASAIGSTVQQDVEGYAIASCLTYQASPYLQEQGDAWASVIVQRMVGGVDVLPKIASVVKTEVDKGKMAVIRSEEPKVADKALPLMYCSEIIYQPLVQAVIQETVQLLMPYYDKR